MLLQRGIDDVRDCRDSFCLERAPFGFADAVWAGPGEGLEIARLARIGDDQPGNALFITGQDFARQRISALDSGVGYDQRLVICPAILAKAGDIAAIMGKPAERQIAGHSGKALMPSRIG